MEIPTFQRVVMIVALIILILCLIFIGIALYRHRFKENYPPVVGKCPDYWVDISDPKGKDVKCMNALGLGNHTGQRCPDKGGYTTFSNNSHWQGKDGICRKAGWARQCNVTWDGVTNSTASCSKQN